MSKSALFTKHLRHHRGMITSDSCPMCLSIPETILHCGIVLLLRRFGIACSVMIYIIWMWRNGCLKIWEARWFFMVLIGALFLGCQFQPSGGIGMNSFFSQINNHCNTVVQRKWLTLGRLIGLVCPFLLIPETWPLASLFVGNLLLLSNSSSIARQQSIEMAQQAVVGLWEILMVKFYREVNQVADVFCKTWPWYYWHQDFWCGSFFASLKVLADVFSVHFPVGLNLIFV